MTTYFNDLDIQTNHIFDFETDCYFLEPMGYEKKRTRRIITQLIERLNVKIISSVKSTESYNYTHLKNISITSNHSDFDYWFALKLRQYQLGLKNIFEFLDYHLAQSFNSDKKQFNEFLNLNLLQYEKIFFNKKVSKIVKDYRRTNLLSRKNKLHKTQLRKPKTAYSTLFIKNIESNPNYIRNHIVAFMDTWSALKKKNFIDKHTSFEDFKAIFKNQTIEPSKRIIWTGTNKELQWFVKHLVYDSKKVVDLDKDIWLNTMKCFIKDNGKEFTESQLRNASGNKLNRKQLIESLLINF